MTKRPKVTILFDENNGEGYYPARAYEALKNKADVTLQPVKEFDGVHLWGEALTAAKTNPDFIAIDIPNDAEYGETRDILSYVKWLPVKARRKIVFGVVENREMSTTWEHVEPLSFWNLDEYPLVHWDQMKDLKKLGKYEVKHQFDEPKPFSNMWWFDRRLQFLP